MQSNPISSYSIEISIDFKIMSAILGKDFENFGNNFKMLGKKPKS